MRSGCDAIIIMGIFSLSIQRCEFVVIVIFIERTGANFPVIRNTFSTFKSDAISNSSFESEFVSFFEFK